MATGEETHKEYSCLCDRFERWMRHLHKNRMLYLPPNADTLVDLLEKPYDRAANAGERFLGNDYILQVMERTGNMTLNSLYNKCRHDAVLQIFNDLEMEDDERAAIVQEYLEQITAQEAQLLPELRRMVIRSDQPPSSKSA